MRVLKGTNKVEREQELMINKPVVRETSKQQQKETETRRDARACACIKTKGKPGEEGLLCWFLAELINTLSREGQAQNLL